jgi:hypothetical protein
MTTYTYTDPDQGFLRVLRFVLENGTAQDSRNGPVISLEDPFISRMNPGLGRRLVLNPTRDVNPFFTHFETIWMMAGRNDLASLTDFLPSFSQYSDDGVSVRGSAYGFRWIQHFGRNQLQEVIENLKLNKNDRRAVVTMWDGDIDLRDAKVSKDVPCNMQIVFSIKNRESVEELDMTVFNRSNDLVYGMFGSNIYHFSFLHEYMALSIGVSVGRYNQVTNNLHLYVENEATKRVIDNKEDSWTAPSFSNESALSTLGLFSRAEANSFVSWPQATNNAYLRKVSLPVYMSYMIWKNSISGLNLSRKTRLAAAKEVALSIEDEELRYACVNWLQRREDAGQKDLGVK